MIAKDNDRKIERGSSGRRLRILTVGGVLATTLLGLGISPTAAKADTTSGGCTGLAAGNCVQATTGTKDHANHTQWVGWVRSYGWGGASGIVKLEAWGDGFYFSSNVNPNDVNPYREWGAQRWVHSGSGVCGAATYNDGYRSIACISIKV